MSPEEYVDRIRCLRRTYDTLDLTQSGATVVVNSKALHHILPELIAPIDRQYTVRFLTQSSTKWRLPSGKLRQVPLPLGREGQFNLFCNTCDALKRMADQVDPSLFETECRAHHVPVPKAIDNAIVNYVRIVGRVPPEDEPAEMLPAAVTKNSSGRSVVQVQQRGRTPMPRIDEVWARLKRHEGETFETRRGLPFTYTISGAVFQVNRTRYNIPQSEFAKALALVPLEGPGKINDLVRGPAYVWAVLHDARIRMQDW